MATDSTRLRTAKAYIAFFATLDTTVLSTLLSDDTFTHIMAPASLAIPPLNKAEFLAHVGGLRRIMRGFPVFAKEEYLESERGNSVVVWATSRVELRDEVTGMMTKQDGKEEEEQQQQQQQQPPSWEFEGEYVFMLTMDVSGERIVRVVEILDSLKTARDLMPLMARARERVRELEAGDDDDGVGPGELRGRE